MLRAVLRQAQDERVWVMLAASNSQMRFARASIAGAGMAGLAAAVALTKAGFPVAISDSAARAGGRCRSYDDAATGLTIDNGNHLVLSGNAAVAAFRRDIGVHEPLAGPDHAVFAFMDMASGTKWQVRINDGPLPWWVLDKARRVPDTGLLDYWPLRHLVKGGNRRIDAAVQVGGPVWNRLIHPVLLAALNTEPAEASAQLAANVLRETMLKGGRAMCPRIAVPTLAAAFVDPAVAWLAARGTVLATGRRLKAVLFDGDVVVGLEWSDGRQEIAPDEAVVLAVPPWVAGELLPDLTVPNEHRAILNAHFAIAPPKDAPEMLGLIGAMSEWIFCHPDRISVTVSAADAVIDRPREELARVIWDEVARALGMDDAIPAWQIVKEKRATFAATPQQDALRPEARTRWRNLFLAGDYVQNGLPATIEGALRSGDNAAKLIMG
jgi:hydroxysqualene dehydroxylase